TALINIGANDYQAFLFSDLPKTPQEVQSLVTGVVGSIDHEITRLTDAGVDHIILLTQPDFALTPNAQAAGPPVAAFGHQIDLINNAALEQMASTHPNVQVVDIFKLSEAAFTDPSAFDFNPNFTWTGLPTGGPPAAGTFAPNEIAFWDGEHPTSA